MTQAKKVTFLIIHDYTEIPGRCMPGEEVVAIILVYRGRRIWIPWSPTHLVLADYLCRRRWIAQDAVRIADQMRIDPFVRQHGTNAPGCKVKPVRTSRTAVRQKVKRMRDVLDRIIKEEGLDLKASEIIRSEESSTCVVRYRIWADVMWEHWPRQDGLEVNVDIPLADVPPAFLVAERNAQSGARYREY